MDDGIPHKGVCPLEQPQPDHPIFFKLSTAMGREAMSERILFYALPSDMLKTQYVLRVEEIDHFGTYG